jgi:hypothetical protein
MIRVTTTTNNNTFEFLKSKIQTTMRVYTGENTQVSRMDAYWSCYPLLPFFDVHQTNKRR